MYFRLIILKRVQASTEDLSGGIYPLMTKDLMSFLKGNLRMFG